MQFQNASRIVFAVVLPNQPVTLTVEQIAELNEKLSTMRHDVNGYLTVMIASAEMVRLRPEMAERMFKSLLEQPTRITDAVKKFSATFEGTLGINRGDTFSRPKA